MNPLAILKSIASPITEYVKGKQALKHQKAEAAATVEEILTKAAASDSEVAGKIALVRAKNEKDSWKDEYALIVVTAPIVFLMLAAVFAAFGAPVDVAALSTGMFAPLSQVPVWWSNAFQALVLTAGGVTYLKKFQK
jgi:hypothetical protein